jgi:hypothetical protein
MNLQRIRGHSAFMTFMGFAGQESMAFPVVSVDGWGLDFVISLSVSSEQSALRVVLVNR